MTSLDELSHEEFADEMTESLWSDQLWDKFLDPEVIDRTWDALTVLRADLLSKKEIYAESDKSGMARRVRRLLSQTDARLSQVKRWVRNYNREETAEVDAIEKKWGEFAFALAQALEGSSADHLLDEILLNGDLPARDWLPLRRAQQAKKARRSVATN